MTTAAIAGVGSGMAVGGQLYSAMEARRVGRYNANIARANAQSDANAMRNEAAQHDRLVAMLGDELAFIEDVRQYEQARLDETLRREAGTMRAVIGASGLAFEGSPIAVLQEQARQGRIQKLSLDFTAALQKRAVTEEQQQQRYAATMARWGAGERLRLGTQQAGLITAEAGQRMTAGVLGAAGTGLKGWATMKYLKANPTAKW